MTVLNIRGTHGSGKSTIARKIIDRYAGVPDVPSGAKRPAGYEVPLPNGSMLYIVGSYETACGGCDAIQPYSTIWPVVEGANAFYDHVLFEGALISTTYGSIGKAAEALRGDFVYGFLDTPVELCIARVNERRAARGVGPLEDPKNIVSKWATINRLSTKLVTGQIEAFCGRVAVIRCQTPVKDALKLLGVKIAREPK